MTMKWSKQEKKAAREVFDFAYKKECKLVFDRSRQMLGEMEDERGIWELEEYLSNMRRYVDQKYDYRYSVLLIIFARLVNEGMIEISQLSDLEEDKLETIRMFVSSAVGL